MCRCAFFTYAYLRELIEAAYVLIIRECRDATISPRHLRYARREAVTTPVDEAAYSPCCARRGAPYGGSSRGAVRAARAVIFFEANANAPPRRVMTPVMPFHSGSSVRR